MPLRRHAPVVLAALLAACAGRAPARRSAREAPRLPARSSLRATLVPRDLAAQCPLADGRTARLARDRTLTVADAEGQELARAALPGDAPCALAPWGDRAVVSCGTGPHTVHVLGPATPFATLGTFASPPIPGRDGQTLTLAGPCRPDPTAAATDATLACTFTFERGWREWQSPGAGVVLDVWRGRALIAQRSAPERPGADVRLFDIDHGRWLPLELPEPTAAWRRAGFAPDGSVVGLAGTAARVWFVEGSAGGALRLHPLDHPADDLGALDVRRVVFAHGAGLAITRDRGAILLEVEAPGWSPPTSVEAAGPRRAGERVACDGAGCVVDGVVVVSFPPGDPLL